MKAVFGFDSNLKVFETSAAENKRFGLRTTAMVDFDCLIRNLYDQSSLKNWEAILGLTRSLEILLATH